MIIYLCPFLLLQNTFYGNTKGIVVPERMQNTVRRTYIYNVIVSSRERRIRDSNVLYYWVHKMLYSFTKLRCHVAVGFQA